MQEAKISFSKLRHAISEERLHRYKITTEDSDYDVFTRYLWNIELSESLYSPLNIFEISLRNNIHRAFQVSLHPRWLHREDIYLRGNERLTLKNIKREILRQTPSIRKTSDISDSHILSRLPLGFWSGLFKSMYDTGLYKASNDKKTKYDKRIKIWRSVLKPSERRKNGIFPNAKKHNLKISDLGPRVNKIRVLRNQIFHHEPIWNLPDLVTRHREIMEAIRWINISMHQAIQSIDRFPEIYKRGPSQSLQLLT